MCEFRKIRIYINIYITRYEIFSKTQWTNFSTMMNQATNKHPHNLHKILTERKLYSWTTSLHPPSISKRTSKHRLNLFHFPSCYRSTFLILLCSRRLVPSSFLPHSRPFGKKGGPASLRIANFRQVFVREIQPTVFTVYKVALEDRVDS